MFFLAGFRQTGDFSGLSSLAERRGGLASHTATPESLRFVFQEGEPVPQRFELSFYSYIPYRTWF